MGLLDFFKKPKWKNSNKKVRLEAVQEMGHDDHETLLEIVRDDPDHQVCLAALEKIENRKDLEGLLQKKLPEQIQGAARNKLEAVYTELILSSAEECDPSELVSLVTSQELLASIGVEAGAVKLRCQAVAAINKPEILCALLKKHCGKKPALVAVGKIDDPQMLAELSEKAVNKSARSMAARKLKELTGDQKIEEKKTNQSSNEPLRAPAISEQKEIAIDYSTQRDEKKQQRQAVCDQLELLCKEMGASAEAQFLELKKKWPAADSEVDDEALLELQKRYVKAEEGFSATLVEWNDEHRKMKHLTSACDQLEKFLKNKQLDRAEVLLEKNIADLQNVSWRWLKGTEITERFSWCQNDLTKRKEEREQKARVEKEQEENLVGLCLEMEALASASDRFQAEKTVKELNGSWAQFTRKQGKKYEDLEKRFTVALERFWQRQKQFYKEQEWQHWNNKNKKEELCTFVDQLKEENDLHAVSSKLKEYQAAWKEIGPVPKKDSDELWQRFKIACDENYARCRIFYAELDQKRKESLIIKEELCVRAEEHVNSSQWKESAEILKNLQKQWKEAGPGERNKEQALYKRFRKACDQFFDRRSIFFTEQDAQRQENFAAKEKLCQELEELLQEPEMEHGRLIQDLQKKWKEIGPVPRKNDQEIWTRFRGSCDSYYNWLDEQRQDNLQQKVALCEQVEALLPQDAEDVPEKETVDKVVELQKEWKTIGPVPRKEADSIWERFTNQCDTFFTARKKKLQEEETQKLENKIQKEILLQKAGEIIQQDDEREITVQLQALQKEWKLVGPAPREDEQLLWDEFQGLCNAFFAEKEHRYQGKKVLLDENLKKKEELCFQLERLVGKENDESGVEARSGLDLIEQFKIAREANFLLAGKIESTQKKKEEVLRIQQEWKNLGPTYREHEQRLWKRYRKAMDLFFAQ